MPTILKNVSRRYAAVAFTAALVGAAVSSPTPAAARTQQGAELACNPSVSLCDIQYLYYSDATLTTQVGFADDKCGAGYVLHSGVETDYVKMRYWECPF